MCSCRSPLEDRQSPTIGRSELQIEIRTSGREDADSRSAARSCHPPACSDRCSTSRAVPWARRCSYRPGERIWSVQPCRTSVSPYAVCSATSCESPRPHNGRARSARTTLSTRPTATPRDLGEPSAWFGLYASSCMRTSRPAGSTGKIRGKRVRFSPSQDGWPREAWHGETED
jgi:hypothetical protein